MIDLAGPWEVFNSVMILSRGSSMDDQMPFQTYTVRREYATGDAGWRVL